MIIQSKMNFEDDIIIYNNDMIARDIIKHIPLNCWVLFKDIPNNIRGDVINILDSGYSPEVKIVFDETATKFLITRDIPEQISVNLKRYYKLQ